MIRRLPHKLRAFLGDRSGAAMVEFAISLPFLLLVIAIVIEGSRIAWIHQASTSGVRDASRYIARLAPPDACEPGSTVNISDYDGDAYDIVALRMGTSEQIWPGFVPIEKVKVQSELQCMPVTYSADTIPVVSVSVELEIEFPFGGVFGLFGEPLEPLTTIIADESRIYGL